MQPLGIEVVIIRKQDRGIPSDLMFGTGLALNKTLMTIFIRNLCACVAFGATSAFTVPNGSIVQKIKSKTFNAQEIKEISQALHIKIGKPLDLTHIDSEVRRMFASGLFGDVRVYLEKQGDKSVVCFVEGVKLRNLGAVDWSQVEPSIREETGIEKSLVPGQKVDPGELRSVAQKIKTALEERGFSEARVDYELVAAPEGGITDVRFVVTKMDRVRIQEIIVKGVDEELRDSIRLRLKGKDGDYFDKRSMDLSAQAIVDFLFKNQYPGAKVKWSTESVNADVKSVKVIFEVSVGQRYRFLIKGNEVFESAALRSLIGFDLLGQSDAANKIRKILEEKYRSLGYHFVQVDVDIGSVKKDEIVTVNIQISEGPKVLVDAVVFDGLWTESIGNPAAIFFENAVGVLQRKVFWEEGIEESTQRFVKNLRERGFLSASVTGPRVFFSEDRKGVQLFYDLQIGNLYEIKKISFKGTSNVSTQELLDVLSFKVGDTLNREVVRSAAETVRARIQSSGYLDAKVRAEENAGEMGVGSKVEGIEIEFQIEEGPRYYVGTIQIEGLARTQEKVVRREITINPGDPFDPEKVRQSEENISLLGLFSRVEALTSSSSGEPKIKNLVFVLSEIKPGFGEVGLGALYEDPLFRARSFLGVGYRNLFGLNQTASVRSEVSLPISRSNVLIPFVEYAALVNYRAPYLADLPFAFTVQGGFTSFQVASSSDGKQSDLQTRARLEERIEKRFGKGLMAQYRVHRLERTRTELIERKDSGGTATLSDTVDVIGSTGPNLILDLRNDAFNPTSGSLHSVDLEFAHPNLLSSQDLSFLLALQRNSFYIPISRLFNLSVFVGMGWSRALMGRGLPEARLANELALGGQGSIRGYAPRLFRAPAGVREMAFYNVRTEVSVPLFGEVSGAVFFDTGQLFPELKADRRNDGIGLGIRYKTPVGPIVLDLAHGLSPVANSIIRFTFTVGSI
ncbi:MAG: hypothetical protein EBQ92_11450 [Proteobacteria bacterium]|nr:hypothetical protein [Pseudomonadota bacterium]